MTAKKVDSVELRTLVLAGLSVKEMSEHFKCTTETVHRSMRREGIHDRWVQQRCKHHVCEYCGKPSAVQFCSGKCWALSRRRVITTEMLSPYIENGTSLLRMSAELKISRNMLRTALLRLGLHKNWAQRRYKKCAFQKAGPTLVITAFDVATIPSARSVGRTDGSTSYGN